MGLVKISALKEDDGVSILASSNSDFPWDIEQLYRDTVSGRYVWEAQGMFDSGNDWASECFCSPYYFWYNLGGDEGFGVSSLHRDVNIASYGFWTLNDDLKTATDRTNNVSEITEKGVTWAWQDKVYAGGLFGKNTIRIDDLVG